MKKYFLIIVFLFSSNLLTSQSWALPDCPSSGYFHNCFGQWKTSDGNEVYQGEFQNDMYEGNGQITYFNGDRYVGEFKKNMKYGFGTYYYANGNKYVGEFKDRKVNGEGIEYNADGSIYRQGVYKDGVFQYAKKIERKPQTNSNEVLQAASGTGFVVSKEGHIVTNHHVIEGCTEVKVHKGGDVFKGKVIANDIINDLALIKSNFKPNVIFPLSDKNPSLLEDIYVAGFPFGNAISSSVKVTKGVVSSESGFGNNYSNIQIDAAIQQGNSGGPILDENGNVVAVAVSKLDVQYVIENFGSIPENINFGIKSSVVENLIQAHNVNNPSPNTKEMSKSDLGYNIKQATLYLSCWMTLAQIKKFSTKKVIFRDLVN